MCLLYTYVRIMYIFTEVDFQKCEVEDTYIVQVCTHYIRAKYKYLLVGNELEKYTPLRKGKKVFVIWRAPV